MFTVAETDLDESAWLVAVTVTVAGEGTVVGAVYFPTEVAALEIDPTVEFPPAVPFIDQVTATLEVPVTLATNHKDWLAMPVVEVGLTVMLTTAGGAGGLGEGLGLADAFPLTRPEHDVHPIATQTVMMKRIRA
jgi:hypothetical protein